MNQVLQPAPQAQGGGGGAPYAGPEASEAKPFVMCPSAMLCVPRYFKQTMVNLFQEMPKLFLFAFYILSQNVHK